MRIFSSVEVDKVLESNNFDYLISRLSTQLTLVEGAYAKPASASKQIALSRLFAYRLVQQGPVWLYVTTWGITMEISDLFYAYRRSMGDARSLIEAPVHLIEQEEEEVLVSLLFMVFAFSWDAWVLSSSEKTLIRVSHDGWLEIRTNEENSLREIAFEMHDYEIPLLQNS